MPPPPAVEGVQAILTGQMKGEHVLRSPQEMREQCEALRAQLPVVATDKAARIAECAIRKRAADAELSDAGAAVSAHVEGAEKRVIAAGQSQRDANAALAAARALDGNTSLVATASAVRQVRGLLASARMQQRDAVAHYGVELQERAAAVVQVAEEVADGVEVAGAAVAAVCGS